MHVLWNGWCAFCFLCFLGLMIGCVKIAGWMAALNLFLVLCFGVVACLLIYNLPMIIGGILAVTIIITTDLLKMMLSRLAKRA